MQSRCYVESTLTAHAVLGIQPGSLFPIFTSGRRLLHSEGSSAEIRVRFARPAGRRNPACHDRAQRPTGAVPFGSAGGEPYTAPPPVAAPSYAPPPPAVGAPAFDPYATTPPPSLADGAVPGEPGQPTTFIGNATRFFQQIDFDSTYIFGNNQGNNLGITDVETSATFAIPIFKNPFLVTPGFAAHFWNGPNTNGFGVTPGPEMPPETYDAYLDTTWKPQITPRLSADLAVRVGLYSDFNFISYQSVRTPFRALGLYAMNPQLTFVAGVVYLDRLSVRILPAGGVIWVPDLRFSVRAVVSAAEAFAPHRDGA